MSNKPQKVFIFGIDGLPSNLFFKKYINQLPNFKKLAAKGTYGTLYSTVPPYSTCAWTTFNSGYDPGTTGIHGFVVRPDRGALKLIDSRNVKVPRIWDIFGAKNKKSVVLNVPLTYPASRINGVMITDFLTPRFDSKSVYPPSIRQMVKKLLGGRDYPFDIQVLSKNKIDLDLAIQQTYQMSEDHFKIARYFFEKEKWDLFNFVAIGTDRLHHMFWKHIDPSHRFHDPKSRYKNVILEYYKYIDKNLGWFISHTLLKNALIVIASDHGMDKMEYQFNINDWLIEEGFLKLNASAEKLVSSSPQQFSISMIDKKNTRAFASGGYFGRIYIIKNKEKTMSEIMNKVSRIKKENGVKLKAQVFKTSDIYEKFDPEAPELIIFFENLICGVNTDMGNKTIYKKAVSDIDNAGHSMSGSYILAGAGINKNNKEANIMQIVPTIFKLTGIKDYKKMPDKPII